MINDKLHDWRLRFFLVREELDFKQEIAKSQNLRSGVVGQLVMGITIDLLCLLVTGNGE